MAFRISKSKIHGKGVFSTHHLQKGESVGEAIVYEWWGPFPIPVITNELGVWINHSYHPNTILEWRSMDGRPKVWHLVTLEPVAAGEELTVDYEHTPWYIEGARPHYV
jgi:SET domain-containing protein